MAPASPDGVLISTQIAMVTGLLADYAACIDGDELERWPDFFTEGAQYRITTAFNHARGLPIGIIDARNRNMLEDRVTALRKANIYEPQRYRHIISVVRVTGTEDGLILAEAGFMVVRTMIDGSQDLFVSGRYLDYSVAKLIFCHCRKILRPVVEHSKILAGGTVAKPKFLSMRP